MVEIVILGGSFAGNKGAASMVRAVMDGARERWPGAEITVLSPLASEDRRFVAHDPDVRLIPFGPREIIAGVLAASLYRCSNRHIASGHRAVRALESCDVVVDVSGISFVDGRGLTTLAYNVLLMLAPLLVGRPVVKVAQAMGPFTEASNRFAARRVLSRMKGVAARGNRTSQHLRELGLDHETAPDVAFLMRVTDRERNWARTVVPSNSVAVVSPSMVVAAHPEAEGYAALMTEVVNDLSRRHDVLLVPHASRPGRPASRLNDLPLCVRVFQQVRFPNRCRVVGEEVSPGALRALIGQAEILVTSRFHAMISGLAVGTPVLVVGWSHKYREVLEEFGLSEWAIDFRRASVDRVLKDLHRLLDAGPEIRARIEQELPEITAQAEFNIDLIERALGASCDRR